MPWPIQRRRALTLLNVIDEDGFCNLKRVMHEEDTLDALEEGDAVVPFDLERARVDWARWRENTIEKYRLHTTLHFI
ncbi:MAG: hypothetical protein Q8S00_22205 [Deltaproteobacteria bacterium]|nr:hypothetical protein [Deltaproteobacteria bacterium]